MMGVTPISVGSVVRNLGRLWNEYAMKGGRHRVAYFLVHPSDFDSYKSDLRSNRAPDDSLYYCYNGIQVVSSEIARKGKPLACLLGKEQA